MSANKIYEEIENGNWRAVLELLENGCDPNSVDEIGTPLLLTLLEHYPDDSDGHAAILKMVSMGAKINSKRIKNFIFDSILPVDVIRKIYESSKFSLPKNVLSLFIFVDHPSDYQMDLIRFIETTDFEMTPQNMGIAIADAFPNYPLWYGMHGSRHEHKNNIVPVVDYLLSKGADINAKSSEGHTPLMRAAMNACPELCEYFIHKGADVNAQSDKGYTALMFASGKISGPCVWESHDEDLMTIEILLKRGADKKIKSNAKRTALSYATSSENSRAIELLKE